MIRRPLRLSTKLTIGLFVILLLVAISIGGGALIATSSAHRAQAVQEAGAVKECEALHVLDSARIGIVFPQVNAAHPSEEALSRIFAGIHGVYEHSGCAQLLEKF